jgi:hypothetical protein
MWSKKSTYFVLGASLSMIICMIIAGSVSQSCDYHEPINKEQSALFKMFFRLRFFHPEPKGFYWLFCVFGGGITFGYFSYAIRTMIKK